MKRAQYDDGRVRRSPMPSAVHRRPILDLGLAFVRQPPRLSMKDLEIEQLRGRHADVVLAFVGRGCRVFVARNLAGPPASVPPGPAA